MQLSPKAKHDHQSGHSTYWLATLASTIIAIAVISIWVLLNDTNRRHLELLTSQQTRIAETLIRQDLVMRMSAIERLAQRWVAADGTPRTNWEEDAGQYLKDMPGFQSIEWVNSAQHVRWAVPHESNKFREDRDVSMTDPAQIAFADPLEHPAPRASQPFEFVNGDVSILIHAPVTRDDKFDGLMVGILRLETWLDAVFTKNESAQYRTQVFIAEQLVHDSSAFRDAADAQWSKNRRFEAHGLQWMTRVAVTDDSIAATQVHVSALILVLGLVLSGVIGMVVHQWVKGRLRARALRLSSNQLSALIANVQGMVYRTLDHRYPWSMQFVSGGCKTLSGYERSDLEKQRVLWGDLIHPESREHVTTEISNAIANNKAFEIVYRIRTKDAGEKWVWERGRKVHNTDSNTFDLEGFVADITDLKLAETKIAQEKAYSKSIVDSAAEAIITIDTTGTIASFNHAAETMFDYTREEVLGKNVRMLMPQPYRGDYDQYLGRYLDRGEARIFGRSRQVDAQHKDGSVFPIQLSISEIKNQNKRMFVGLIRDLTKEKAAEEEARLHSEQLAHVDRLHLLGEMATGIAHEINQPLTSISLFSQAGKRFLDVGAFDRLPDIFDKLSQHALRAGSIIEQMQAMTRQRESERTTVECECLINGITQLAEGEAHIHDIEIEVDIPAGLPTVLVDTVQIQQVTLNLLRNGMEAMQSIECRNGDVIRLRVGLRNDGDVEIMIVDSGNGVSTEVAATLFTPFSTTKDSGMGMGLSISHAIVNAHGGQLNFVNNESKGATFYFNLPVGT